MATVKLLLADKNEIFCEGLAKLLEAQPDIEVVCACRTGLEAIERANEHQPDVILMDTELSECSSIEAIQRIHERLPNTNIIVLTHSEADADLISTVKAGAKAYISKDVCLEGLIKAIALVANHQVVVSPPMTARLLTEISLSKKHKGRLGGEDCSHLSKREEAVLSLVAQGLTNREIATSLFISEHTTKVHLRNIMRKCHARTRQRAAVLARAEGVLPRYIQADAKQV